MPSNSEDRNHSASLVTLGNTQKTTTEVETSEAMIHVGMNYLMPTRFASGKSLSRKSYRVEKIKFTTNPFPTRR